MPDLAPPPAAPPATSPPAGEGMDATFKLLFEAADSEKPIEEKEKDKGGRSLMQAIDTPVPPEDPAAAKAKADAEAKAKLDKSGDPPPAEDTGPKVRKRKAEPAPAPPAPPPVAPKPEPEHKSEPSPDAAFEAGLLEEEKDQLELARFAEGKDPAKYRGYAGRVTKFLKDHQTYLEKNPSATDPNGDGADEYKAWLAKNNINLPPRELKLLEREQIEDRALSRARNENDTKFADIHDENFRRDKLPEIAKQANEFFQKLAADALPAELAKDAKEKGVEEAKKLHPLEFRVSVEEMTQAASDIEELRKITTYNPKTGKPVVMFNSSNPQHEGLLTFIRTQCENFKNGAPGETPQQKDLRLRSQVQKGLSFLGRDEYMALKPEQRAAYWTFTIDDIVAMKAAHAKNEIARRVKEEHTRREAEGYTRRVFVAPGTPAPPGFAPTPPAPGRPTPIPSRSNGTAEVPDRTFNLLMGEAV